MNIRKFRIMTGRSVATGQGALARHGKVGVRAQMQAHSLVQSRLMRLKPNRNVVEFVVENSDDGRNYMPEQIVSCMFWRRRQESNPPRDVLRPSPDLKSGRPTGDDSPPCSMACVIAASNGASITGRGGSRKSALGRARCGGGRCRRGGAEPSSCGCVRGSAWAGAGATIRRGRSKVRRVWRAPLARLGNRFRSTSHSRA